MSEVVLKRTAFTTATVTLATRKWRTVMENYHDKAKRFGCCLILDGKTNIMHSSLIFYGFFDNHGEDVDHKIISNHFQDEKNDAYPQETIHQDLQLECCHDFRGPYK